MVVSDPSDEELLRRIAGADQDAVRTLYQRHGRLVYSLAMRVLGNVTAAEEVTQDVFVRVWEKAASYDPSKARVGTWLARIARNRAIDVLRSAAMRSSRAQANWDDMTDAPDMTAADPGKGVIDSQRRDEVRAAVGSLPADQRRALMLAFFHGLTHEQISRALGTPLGTVKTRIRDAMRKLRAGLDERGGG